MIGACCCHSHYSRHQALVANGIVPRTSPAPSLSANADGGAELHTATPSLRERLTAADSALVRTNAEQKALVPPPPTHSAAVPVRALSLPMAGFGH